MFRCLLSRCTFLCTVKMCFTHNCALCPSRLLLPYECHLKGKDYMEVLPSRPNKRFFYNSQSADEECPRAKMMTNHTPLLQQVHQRAYTQHAHLHSHKHQFWPLTLGLLFADLPDGLPCEGHAWKLPSILSQEPSNSAFLCALAATQWLPFSAPNCPSGSTAILTPSTPSGPHGEGSTASGTPPLPGRNVQPTYLPAP